jgi:hypothetical protein
MQWDNLVQALFLHLALGAAQESTEGEQGYGPHPGSVSERAENCIVQSVQYSGSVCFQQPVTFIAFIAPSFVKKIPTLITSQIFFVEFFFQTLWIACLALIFPCGFSHLPVYVVLYSSDESLSHIDYWTMKSRLQER